MSELILLRHGQAMFGADHYDRLSSLGEAQARATAEYFAAHGVTFTRAICGPRERHKVTATLSLTGADSPPLQVDPFLDEFAEGSKLLACAELRTGIPLLSNPGLPKAERLRHYGEQIRLWAADAAPMEGVESVDAFRRRIAAWLDTVLGDETPGQQVVAVTSAGVIAAAYCDLLGLSNAFMADAMWHIGNCSLTGIVWSPRGRSVRYFNQTAHLAPQLGSGI